MVTASLYFGQLFAMQRQQLEILKEFYVKSLTCTCINYFKVALADGSSWRKGIDLTEIGFFSSFKLILHNSSKLSAFVNCLLSVMESWCLNKVKGVFFSDLLWLVDAYINMDVSWYTNVCLMKGIVMVFFVLFNFFFFLNEDTCRVSEFKRKTKFFKLMSKIYGLLFRENVELKNGSEMKKFNPSKAWWIS